MSDRTYMLPISNGLLTQKHHKQIGPALWVFVWMIDRETRDDGRGPGRVLRGDPLPLSRIATELAMPFPTVRKHIARLEKFEYIDRIDHGSGKACGYVIAKPKKWTPSKNGRSQEATPSKNGQGPRPKMTETPSKNGRANKEDNTDLTYTSSATAGEEKSKQADPRFTPTKERIFKNHEKRFGIKPTWDGAEAGQLSRWLRASPDVSQARVLTMVDNVYASDRDPGRPCAWLHDLGKWANSPLDGFGKPKIAARAPSGPTLDERVKAGMGRLQ